MRYRDFFGVLPLAALLVFGVLPGLCAEGLLADAVNELTADAGVNVDGVRAKDGNIEATQNALSVLGLDATPSSGANGGNIVLSPGAGDGAGRPGGVVLSDGGMAPAATVNTLYNVGGNLYWNGVMLDASASVDKSQILNSGVLGFSWIDGEVADALTIQGGSVNNDSFSAYSDLGAEGYLNNDAGGDVLTRTQSDGRYLQSYTESDTLTSVTGRGATTSTQVTLGGGVKVDSIGENTLNNGVSIDGVKARDSFVELTSISAPSPTTARLYNAGGNLYWNGTQLGGGSTQTEVWDQICSAETYPDLNIQGGIFGYTINSATATGDRYGQFVNQPEVKVLQSISYFFNVWEAFVGARTITLSVEIHDITTGAVTHTTSTSSVSALAVPTKSWHTIPITGVAADRTIEITEILVVKINISGAASAGNGELRFYATVE